MTAEIIAQENVLRNYFIAISAGVAIRQRQSLTCSGEPVSFFVSVGTVGSRAGPISLAPRSGRKLAY